MNFVIVIVIVIILKLLIQLSVILTKKSLNLSVFQISKNAREHIISDNFQNYSTSGILMS